MDTQGRVTAAVLVIGDEILSGRTQDTNLNAIARYLAPFGVDLAEARVVGDNPPDIIGALNALRTTYDYVITTGGIGPTHDDITADCVAEAFGVELYEHPDILAMMHARWGVEINPAGGWRGCRLAAVWSTIRCRARPASRWKTSSFWPACR